MDVMYPDQPIFEVWYREPSALGGEPWLRFNKRTYNALGTARAIVSARTNYQKQHPHVKQYSWKIVELQVSRETVDFHP